MEEIRDKNGLTEAEFLANYKVKDYPRPSLTADILVFNQFNGNLQLLLIKRGGHPFINKWALPGGFVQQNERADQAAARELFEALKIKKIYVRYFNKPRIDNYLRVTIGTDEEMDALLAFFRDYLKKKA